MQITYKYMLTYDHINIQYGETMRSTRKEQEH